MLENHCTLTAQSSCGGCSRRVHKIVYQTVNKGNILVTFFASENIQPTKILLSRYTAGFISDYNSRWIFSEVKILTQILHFLTARYTILCTHRLQPPCDDCAVREYSGSLA